MGRHRASLKPDDVPSPSLSIASTARNAYRLYVLDEGPAGPALGLLALKPLLRSCVSPGEPHRDCYRVLAGTVTRGNIGFAKLPGRQADGGCSKESLRG